jgi:lysozyme
LIDERLIESIKRHEGWRNKAYQDSLGVWTIGYGTNLQELIITEEQGERWLIEHLEDFLAAAKRFPEWEYLDTKARRNVFVEMIYNMGPSRVAGFKNMLGAFREQDWELAAKEMLTSRWAEQVGTRAERLAALMRQGTYS